MKPWSYIKKKKQFPPFEFTHNTAVCSRFDKTNLISSEVILNSGLLWQTHEYKKFIFIIVS